MKEVIINITEETSFNKPSLERDHPVALEGSGEGIQKIWRFKNGFGASVVRFSIGGLGGSYGYDAGLWELGIIKFDKEGSYNLTYETGITEDVLGHLTKEDVVNYLKRIKELKKWQIKKNVNTVVKN